MAPPCAGTIDAHLVAGLLQDMRKGSRELYRRQLAAADSSSLYTIVTNRLGIPAEVELDFGDHWCARRTSSCGSVEPSMTFVAEGMIDGSLS